VSATGQKRKIPSTTSNDRFPLGIGPSSVGGRKPNLSIGNYCLFETAVLYAVRRVGAGRRWAAILQSNTIWAGADGSTLGDALGPVKQTSSFPYPPARAQAPAGIQAVCRLSQSPGVDDACGIKWVPAFAGTTSEVKLGSFLRFFCKSCGIKGFQPVKSRAIHFVMPGLDPGVDDFVGGKTEPKNHGYAGQVFSPATWLTPVRGHS